MDRGGQSNRPRVRHRIRDQRRAVHGFPSEPLRSQADKELQQNEELAKLLTINQRVLRHNLRNNISVALGYLDFVDTKLDGTDPDVATVRSHLHRLLETSEQARRLVSIWETEALTDMDIAGLLAECVDGCRERSPDSNLALEVNSDARIVAHLALEEAITEDITNAIEHNDSDVHVTVRCSTPSPGVVLVEIADPGCGIPSIEKAVRSNPRETQLEHGIGLGLWLIYWVVKKVDGHFAIRDNEPNGTVIELRLPVASDHFTSRRQLRQL